MNAKFYIVMIIFMISLSAEYVGPNKTITKKIPTHMKLQHKTISSGHHLTLAAQQTVELLPGAAVAPGGSLEVKVSSNIPREVSITGPVELYENSKAQYKSTVIFPNGHSKDITNNYKWHVSHSNYASIHNGLLTTKAVKRDFFIDIVISTVYEGYPIEVSFEVKILKEAYTSLRLGWSHDVDKAAHMAQADGHKVIHVDNGLTAGSGPDTPWVLLGGKKARVAPHQRITGIAIIGGPDGITGPPGYTYVGDLNKGCGYGTAGVYLYYKHGYHSNPVSDLKIIKSTTPPQGYFLINVNLNFGCNRYIDKLGSSNDQEYHGVTMYLSALGGEYFVAETYGKDSDYAYRRVEGYINQRLEVLQREFKKAEKKFIQIKNDAGAFFDKLENLSTYETTKWKVRDRIRKGGWRVAWGREVTEVDLLEIAGAIGADVYGGGGTATMSVLEQIGLESIEKLSENVVDEFSGYFEGQLESLMDEVTDFAQQIILTFFKALIDGKSPEDAIGDLVTALERKAQEAKGFRIEFKAGVAEYSGKNKVAGVTLSPTISWQPYIAVRLVRP
ncbi:hypothetical protein UABAM_04567 [Candidatus Uabimicrobium amorphum]|uniref:Uncharacterized protein n=1 Tax=Uabimicrobium amorphum TaxID=2596890 RepID=A0A5S9IRE9_UABAM|nr:hypothetical protein [Candidatus Uabimicrobium amorphum]BBM86181.1 hypothetical protein UABAM_04567 [Candidatus Uabimicrobium amorphum]